MRCKDTLVRLYFPEAVTSGASIILNKLQLHYLVNVLRVKDGHLLKVFNQNNGEFLAQFIQKAKDPYLLVKNYLRAPEVVRYLHLGICVIRNTIMSDVIDQATQLGVSCITPIISAYTQNKEVNIDRYQRIAIEATEQSGRCSVPLINSPQKIDDFLNESFDLLVFANESEELNRVSDIKIWPDKLGVLVGPEGGFSELEINKVNKVNNCYSVSLGKNILRSETAVIAILSQISLYI